MKKKNANQKIIKIDLALATADCYLNSANYLKKNINEKNADHENNASTYVTISNLAFGIEIYLKVLILILRGKTPNTKHDLAASWKKLPKEVRNWMSYNFDNLFDKDKEKWSRILRWAANTTGTKISSYYQRGLNVDDIIKGHKYAYDIGRYCYETPKGDDTDTIAYNIQGLVVVSWLLRSLAYQYYEILKENRKNGNSDTNEPIHFSYPDFITKFPFPS